MEKNLKPTLVMNLINGNIVEHVEPALQVTAGLKDKLEYPIAVYALVRVIPAGAKTDYKDGYYYWTNAEGVRRRIQDLDTEHLKGILEMPDFKNSRLTLEMRRAIQREINQRNTYYFENRA